MPESPLPPAHLAALLFAASVAWCTWRVLYNIYLHPLSRFPGPRAAASTRLWLAYVEVFKGVSLTDLRNELHAEYGNVVRISPNELHFSDPAAYDAIYNTKNKWDKDYEFYRAFDMDSSSLCYIKYPEAKQRRDVLSTLFSRSSILKMQDLVQAKLEMFCDVLKSDHAAGKASDLSLGFKCLAMDTISSFCYGRSMSAIDAPNFHAPLVIASENCLPILAITKHSGFLVWLLRQIPPRLAVKLGSPVMDAMFHLKKVQMRQIEDILRDPSELENAPHPIIYHELLNIDAQKGRLLPSKLSLFHEAQVLLAAGTDTVGVALMSTVYHLLAHPDMCTRLRMELRSVWLSCDECPRYEVLEKLPYLTAVVKEGLRLFPGLQALPRVVPPEGAVVCGIAIPGGTIVGQSLTFVSHAESIFPNAKSFDPERWLQADSKSLEGFITAFSKGPRSCLGINLAYCELYTALAYIFRRFELQADPTRQASLSFKEHFVPYFTGEHLHVFCKPVDT
ncbi:putative cytochrome P450 [Artomyces pyxidatus]|uniref:Cytochrome P450 n=1 Tax=Artomyces pyxidatus TaxID=48021 RepID=A0ACB8SQX7_9AGAM|nr:putative cytochrome P450 [Artomyces pyxidatus]